MKKKLTVLLISLVIGGLFLALAGKFQTSLAFDSPFLKTNNNFQRKIVVFKSGVLNEPARESLIEKFGGVMVKNLNLISGKVVLLPPQAVEILRYSDGVLRIDDDVVVEALRDDVGAFAFRRPTATPTIPPAQIIPWGVNQVNALKIWGVTTGNQVKVAIIDTGIYLKHPDLKDNLKGGVSTIWYTGSYNDDNGHGTHVAGIVAALDNSYGVVGVGPQIDLYSVKVLDRRGSGYLSDIIEGLDWAIQNGMQVINMSLGTSSNVQSFHDAVLRVNNAGIVQVAAAGNSGGAVIYPAAYPEVIAVSATDQTNMIASWSSRGPEVDLSAPGVNIYSTYKGSSYQTLSGTSMASPHVAGAAALVLTQVAKCDLNLDSICSPNEVQQRLEATASDLGDFGKDNLFGSGLINIEKAVLY